VRKVKRESEVVLFALSFVLLQMLMLMLMLMLMILLSTSSSKNPVVVLYSGGVGDSEESLSGQIFLCQSYNLVRLIIN
jgi:hypothetical protein